MGKFRRIDVLLNAETKERFNKDDLVKVTTGGLCGREVVGRVHLVETVSLVLDTSKEYKSCREHIRYEDIRDIIKVGTEDD